MDLRPYDPDRPGEPAALWRCKRAFELELGGADPDKRRAYEGKLDDAYRRRYLDWVGRCVADDPRCVTVADTADEAVADTGDGVPSDPGSREDTRLAGYVFVLPERLAMVWDAAVLNELYVAGDHRGTGLADDLIRAALDLARDQDPPLDRLVLDVDPDNGRARAVYERHGFERWGEMLAREL